MFNWLNKLLKLERKGSPCQVIGLEAGVIENCPGRIMENVDNGFRVEYQWIDKTMHSFTAAKGDHIGHNHEGIPTYSHDVGNIFSGTTDSKIGSEFFYKIVNSNLGSQAMDYMEDMQRSGSINWKRWLIIGAIAIALIYLWQTGFLTQILNDVVPKTGA